MTITEKRTRLRKLFVKFLAQYFLRKYGIKNLPALDYDKVRDYINEKYFKKCKTIKHYDKSLMRHRKEIDRQFDLLNMLNEQEVVRQKIDFEVSLKNG